MGLRFEVDEVLILQLMLPLREQLENHWTRLGARIGVL